MENALIRLTELSKYYTSNQAVVMGLHNLSLSFRRGEFVAITGESGSGKSTLSHVIGGILPYESGELYFRGSPTSHYDSQEWERYRRDNISFISQSYGILPGATVLSNVVTALRLSGMEKKEAKAAAGDILRQVELWDLRRRRAAKLSSGQKQRLSIARALAKPAPILIADEPTGNLDPENSKKVIELLAQAAKDRLVLLVTHEFSEAEDVATRHIVLQDGKLVMDAPLRPANEPGPMPAARQASRKALSPYVARVQQASRPVWSTLTAAFFALTAFAVFAFLGAFIIALDDTNTRIYDDSAFANGSMERIVVTTLGQRPLTEADYETILNTKYVTTLETNGYLSDVQYAYREDVDFTVVNSEEVTPNGDHYMVTTYHPRKDAPFMRTVPLLAEGEVTLTQGRMPEHFHEVVAHSSDGLQPGDTVRVMLINQKYWGSYMQLWLDFTVVGVTDYGSGLYFHNDVGRFMQQVAKSENGNRYRMFLPENPQEIQERMEALAAQQESTYDCALPEGFTLALADDQLRMPASMFTQLTGGDPELAVAVLECTNINLELTGEDPLAPENKVALSTPRALNLPATLKDTGGQTVWSIQNHIHSISHNRILEVSQATFDLLTWQAASEQVSVTIEDYAYTQRVIDALEGKGYLAVSPYRQGSAKVDTEKAQQRMQTLKVCLAALAAVVVLQVLLLRAMFSAQTESYRLLSNIGLVSTAAKLSVLWQVLGFTVLGQLAGAAAIWICGSSGIERIAQILRYLPPKYIALLSGVHLAASLLAALWVMLALGKQVYPLAGKFSDLALDDTGKEAAV